MNIRDFRVLRSLLIYLSWLHNFFTTKVSFCIRISKTSAKNYSQFEENYELKYNSATKYSQRLKTEPCSFVLRRSTFPPFSVGSVFGICPKTKLNHSVFGQKNMSQNKMSIRPKWDRMLGLRA